MSIKYSDSGFLDGADETKKLSFDVSGVTTGTTRTITMPDANVDLSSVGTPDDNSVTLAKMAAGTDGELITYDTSGDPTTVPTGSSGEVLTSNGAGTTPTFQAAAAGKVLQVVTASTSAETTSTTATYADTGLTATITPTLATSTILVSVFQNGLRHYGGNTDINLYLQKDGVNWKYIGERISALDSASPAASSVGGAGGQYLDSPADTSAHTYKTKFSNRLATGYVRVQDGAAVSTITLMEIGV